MGMGSSPMLPLIAFSKVLVLLKSKISLPLQQNLPPRFISSEPYLAQLLPLSVSSFSKTLA